MAKKIKAKEKKNIDFPGIIAGIWTVCMLVIQPLIVNRGYADILESKYRFFLVSSGIMLALIILYELIKKNFFKGWFDKLNILDIFMIGFGGIAIISTLQAYPYSYAAFFGNKGRYCGMIFLVLVVLDYFAISRNLKHGEKYIEYFVKASIIVALWAITDYWDKDIRLLKVALDEKSYAAFSSTIGNIDTLAGFLAVPLGVTGIMCSFKEEVWKAVLYWISFTIVAVAMITSVADTAYLGFMAFFAIAPFFTWKTHRGFRRYFVLLATFVSALTLVNYWNIEYEGVVIFGESLLYKIVAMPFFKFWFIILWVVAAIIYTIDLLKKTKPDTIMPKAFTWAWTAAVAAVVVGVMYLLVRANSAEHYVPASLEGFRSVLVFSDEWGTYRGYIWRASLENYGKLPIHHILFGTGPETSSIYMWNWKLDEMISTTRLIFDNPHNEWLQMFITIGPFGFVAYLGTYISPLILSWKNRLKKVYPYMLALSFGCICHLIESFTNIMTPIDVPTVYGLMIVAGALFRRCDEA